MNEPASWRERSIELLDLSIRSYNALKRSGHKTLGELYDLVAADRLLDIRHVGSKSQAEIREKLQTYLATLSESAFEPLQADTEIVGTAQHIPSDTVTASPHQPLDNSPDEPLLAETSMYMQPAWHFHSIRLLDLSPKLLDALKRSNLRTLGELRDLLAANQLSILRNIGAKSEAEIREKFHSYLVTLPESAFELVELSEVGEPGSVAKPPDKRADMLFKDRITPWLSSLPEKSYRTIIWRYGVFAESLTLEEIGEQLGVTRERVRQIESKALRQLQHPRHRDLIGFIVAAVNSAFERVGYVMTDEEMTEVGYQFVAEGMNGLALMRLLSKISDEFTQHKRASVWVWKDRVDVVLAVQTEALLILRTSRAPMAEELLLDHLRKSDVYSIYASALSEDFLRACLRTHPDLERREDGLLGLVTWAKRRTDDIILALRQIGRPAHYTEITQAVNKLLSQDMQAADHNVHAQMQRYPDIFVRVGQGTYGLAEWGLEPSEFYSDIIERIFREYGHPLSLQEVFAKVCEVRDCKESTVVMLLSLNPDRFRSVPGGMYGLAEWRNDEFPDPSYREKRLIAAIASDDTRNERKPKPEVTRALRDIDDLISLARSVS